MSSFCWARASATMRSDFSVAALMRLRSDEAARNEAEGQPAHGHHEKDGRHDDGVVHLSLPSSLSGWTSIAFTVGAPPPGSWPSGAPCSATRRAVRGATADGPACRVADRPQSGRTAYSCIVESVKRRVETIGLDRLPDGAPRQASASSSSASASTAASMAGGRRPASKP